MPAATAHAPADQALGKVVELLTEDGFGITVPAWDGDAYLRISSALHAITDLTITSHGNVIWEYRSIRCPHIAPARLIGMVIEVLDPDRTRRAPSLPVYYGFPLVEVIRYGLFLYGFAATISEAGPVLTVANPDRPDRGTIRISDDGELSWRARAPHHRDGGIPLTDIGATISRALTRAGVGDEGAGGSR